VLGEVIRTEEVVAAAFAVVAAKLLPHAVKPNNATSDSAPIVLLRKFNISPSFFCKN